jgi:sigma-E factor negative regulatory protein RseB
MIPRQFLFPTSFVCFLVSLPVFAATEAQDWLMRIHRAAERLNYDGTFVYQHGAQLETMRIFHRADKGVVKERLISLTGPAREVIRTDEEVRCYLPDQKSVVVEHRRVGQAAFVAIVPERLGDLEENYVIELGHKARVAGRAAQQLLIRARDDFRYGYRLWADRDTGLLLKADLTDEKGALLEQFLFTQVNIGGSISDAALAPQTTDSSLVWYRDNDIPLGAPVQTWQATQVPKGFKLSSTVMRRLPKGNRVVEQLVYSDSLAAVSIFVERLNDRAPSATMMDGPTRVGALHAFGKTLDGHHVTVVGEVPTKTIDMIGNSLVLASPAH